MLPIKKIVAPTDFSDPSYRGLAAAEELARHFSGELIIVHVVSHVHFVPPTGPPISGGHEIPTLMEELEAGAIKGLKEIQEKRISEKLRSRAVVLRGSAADEIVRTAEEEEADAIVISTHGLTGWRRLVFGSVAEKVVRQATCPVITIPAGEEEGA